MDRQPVPKPDPRQPRGVLGFGSTLRRGAALPPVNPERLARRRELQFGPHGDFIRSLPCVTCYPEIYAEGKTFAERVARARMPGVRVSHCSHVVHSRGAGGVAEDSVPHCRSHHDEWHRVGAETYRARHEDPARIAAALWEISPARAEGTVAHG